MNLQVHIERLILDGIDIQSIQQQMLQTAIEIELTRLITQNEELPGPSTGIGDPHMKGGLWNISNRYVYQISQQVAQAIHPQIDTKTFRNFH